MRSSKASTPSRLLAVIAAFGSIVVFFVNAARADDSIDLTIRTGAAFGTITYINDNNKVIRGGFGGIPFDGLWNRGLSRSMSMVLGGGVLLDLKNSQLIRQSLGGGISWHVLGGPRRYAREGVAAGFVTRSTSSLSLLTYGNLQNFAATDAANTKTQVAGSVFAVDIGLEYRFDLSDVNAVTVEFLNSVFSIPASVSRIKPTATELLFGWRTFI
jgi:hypothetical protein